MDSEQLLPSEDDYVNNKTPEMPMPHPVVDFYGIRWSAFDPPSSVTVLDDDTDPDSAQSPLFREDGTTHPVGNSFITTPPVSSLKVMVHELILYRELSEMSQCDCHPWVYNPPAPLEVTGTGPRGAVTIGDYVSTVSHWIRSLETDIRAAFECIKGEAYPPEMKCYVKPVMTTELLLVWDVRTGELPIARTWKKLAELAKKHRAEAEAGLS